MKFTVGGAGTSGAHLRYITRPAAVKEEVRGCHAVFPGPHLPAYLTREPLPPEALRAYLLPLNIEGIVWTHADGRMVKVKKRDFGMARVQP